MAKSFLLFAPHPSKLFWWAHLIIKIVSSFLITLMFCLNIKNNLDFFCLLHLKWILKMKIPSAHFQDNMLERKLSPQQAFQSNWHAIPFWGITTIWVVSLSVLKNRTWVQKHILILDIIHNVKYSRFLHYWLEKSFSIFLRVQFVWILECQWQNL